MQCGALCSRSLVSFILFCQMGRGGFGLFFSWDYTSFPSVHKSKIAFMFSALTLIGFCIPIQVPNWYLIWRYC
jgi:hypothetical protein